MCGRGARPRRLRIFVPRLEEMCGRGARRRRLHRQTLTHAPTKPRLHKLSSEDLRVAFRCTGVCAVSLGCRTFWKTTSRGYRADATACSIFLKVFLAWTSVGRRACMCDPCLSHHILADDDVEDKAGKSMSARKAVERPLQLCFCMRVHACVCVCLCARENVQKSFAAILTSSLLLYFY